MNKRDEAILAWIREYRSDDSEILKRFVQILDGDMKYAALQLISSVSFEAGRQFQAQNPDLPLDNPNVYDYR